MVLQKRTVRSSDSFVESVEQPNEDLNILTELVRTFDALFEEKEIKVVSI